MKRILWISPYAPYDKVPHGGGQNHNLYLKFFHKNTESEITLLTIFNSDERQLLDLDDYGITNRLKEYNKKKPASIFYNCVAKVAIWRDGGILNNAKYHLLKGLIREYAASGEQPDIIITQWTEVTLLGDYLRKFFPRCKYVGIEEDVAFLGYERKYLEAHGIYKIYKKMKYRVLKRRELEALRKCDLAVVLNKKDEKLLVDNGIDPEKIFCSCVYHGFYNDAVYSPSGKDLLFYGAMNRPENYKSAIWLIENVLPRLDKEYRLIVVGANPVESLLAYQSDRVMIKGFVDDVKPYFEKCLCLAAPLLLGAGIKIKILEAMSAGMPVVTNEIGAEGIGLTDGVNYLHCNQAQEYVEAIERLNMDAALRDSISKNAKQHILNHFDVEEALKKLNKRIEIMCAITDGCPLS